MNLESAYFSFGEGFTAWKWKVNVWVISRVWKSPFVQIENLVIIMNLEIAEIMQKFSNTENLNVSILYQESGISLEIMSYSLWY